MSYKTSTGELLHILIVLVWAGALLIALLGLLPRHGLMANYYVESDGKLELLHSEVAKQLSHPLPGVINAPVRLNWDASRFGAPEKLPEFTVEWRGYIWIDEPGSYRFMGTEPGEYAFSFEEGVKKGSLDLNMLGSERHSFESTGLFPITILYQRTETQAPLEIAWVKPDGSSEQLPMSRLYVSKKDFGWKGQMGNPMFLFGVLVAVVTALIIKFRFAPEASVELIRCRYAVFALAAVVTLGAFLRFHDYDLYPLPGETADEMWEAWAGWSLIHDGQPRAWSNLEGYKDKKLISFLDAKYYIVQPAFDHPPLSPLIAGIVTSLGGTKDFFSCSVKYTRIPHIIFSLITLVLVYCLAWQLLKSRHAALLSALVYAVTPIIAYDNRLAKTDNLLTLLFVAAIVCSLQYIETNERRWRNMALVCIGLTPLAKTTAIALLAALFILFERKGRLKDAFLVLGAGAVGIGAHLLYGYLIDWDTFLKIVSAESALGPRLFGGLIYFITSRTAHFPVLPGWVAWLWLAVVYVYVSRREWILPSVAILYVAFMAAARIDDHGWYRLILFPLMSVCAGAFLKDLIEKPDLFKSALFYLLPVATSLCYWVGRVPARQAFLQRLCLLAFIGPFFIPTPTPSKFISGLRVLSVVVALLLFVIASCFVIWNGLIYINIPPVLRVD